MSTAKPITISSAEAQTHISLDLRNNIYSALLSGDGIRNIETTLDRALAESGFKDELRRYVTELFRSGQATTVDEARALAMDKIKAQMRGDENEAANGVNGAHEDGHQFDLKIPDRAVVEGSRTVKKELEKVCQVNMEDE